jgi:hypothetical protein
VIEHGSESVAIIHPAAPVRRTISECIGFDVIGKVCVNGGLESLLQEGVLTQPDASLLLSGAGLH